MVDPLALSNFAPVAFEKPSAERLQLPQLGRRPRVLLLYGSLRARSYSRFLTLEAARLLEAFGADTRIFDPSGLPRLAKDFENLTRNALAFLRLRPKPRSRG